MTEFEVFKSYYSKELAENLQQLLEAHGIEAKVEKKKRIIDKVIIGDGVETDIYLLIRGEDFSRAEQVIDESVRQHINEIDPDYYLFSFTNDELMEVLQKADEWNNQDVILAKKILADRGQAVSDEEIRQYRKGRLQELAKPDLEEPSLFFLGYVLALIIPIYGIFFGLIKLTSKKVLPDGTKLYNYSPLARQHYVAIMIIGVLSLFGFAFLVSRF